MPCNIAESRDYMVADPAEILRRLEEGDWLRPSEVAAITGLGRTTIHRLSIERRLGFKETPGKHRRYNPADVRKLLADLERETPSES